jgi:hypothetical protein
VHNLEGDDPLFNVHSHAIIFFDTLVELWCSGYQFHNDFPLVEAVSGFDI